MQLNRVCITKILSFLSILWISIGLAGCAVVSTASPSGSVSVTVTPASASVPVSQSQLFDAFVQNDTQSKGVTWALTQSGAACSPACGTLSTAGTNRATYSAPANVPQLSAVTVTATAVSDSTKLASAQIIILPQSSSSVSVSLTPPSASVAVSQNQQFDAVVQNDTQSKGVTWALTQSGAACSPACGAFVGFTAQTAIYAAPGTVPNPSAVTITATSLADNKQSAFATISVAPAGSSGGTNQWADITKFGARSVERAPTATAACISGNTEVTLSNGGWPQDFTQFENGDSIRLDRCGSPTAMTPPTGVVVSPGMNAGGTPAVSGLSMGTTVYSYQIIACDKFGGCSTASTTTTTTSGSANLGRVTAPISRMSLSNNTMTVTTATAHGFARNALVYIQYFSTHTSSFEGWYLVSSVPSATTFTFLTTIDSRIPGTPRLDTSGGTAVAFNCNVILWNAVSGAYRYYIYGRSEGSLSRLGVVFAGQNPAGTQLTSWQDYGSPMMDNQSFPSYVPTTVPTEPSNQYLLTTIVSGGGTNRITVANAPSNTGSGVNAVMGNDAAFLAALNASGNYGTIYIPSGNYPLAGYFSFPDMATTVLQQGNLAVYDTLEIPEVRWTGIGSGAPPAFSWSPSPSIVGVPGCFPTIYQRYSSGGSEWNHVTLGSLVANGGLDYYTDGVSGNDSFDYVTWTLGGGGTTGYMGQLAIFRSGGFSFRFYKNDFLGPQAPKGNEGDIGYTFLPGITFEPNGPTPTGNFEFRSCWIVGRASIEQNSSGAVNGESYATFYDLQTQNAALPAYVVSNFPMVNTPVTRSVLMEGVSPADYPSALVGNWAGQGNMSVTLTYISNAPQGNHPLVVGNPVTLTTQAGGTASSGPPGGGWFAAGGSQVGYLLPPPSAAPLLTVSAGGAVPVGSHTYQTTWIDAFRNSTTVGPSATINIVTGMQTVTVTPSDAPAGAVGWQFYRDGALQGPSSGFCGPFSIGTSQSDPLPFSACSDSPPAQNIAMSSGQGINGLETTQIELTGGGYKSVISGTFTADRRLAVPDVSGTMAVKIANGTVAMPTDSIAAGSCGAVVDAAATGVFPTDVIKFSYNAAPQPHSVDLVISAWPTANNVHFQSCNETAASITPLGTTLNWQVVR
jgi:hypothetical protein